MNLGFFPNAKPKQSPSADLCERCGSTDIVQDRGSGEEICNGTHYLTPLVCGLTKRYRLIDQTAEWRDFSESGDPSKSRTQKTDEYVTELTTEIGPMAFKHGDFQSSNSAQQRMANTQKKIAVHCPCLPLAERTKSQFD